VVAVRYAVHTPNTTIHLWPAGTGAQPYPAHDKYFQISSTPAPDNCFALYRQEGTCVYDDDLGTYTFGSGVDLDGVGPNPPVFVIDRPSAENSVTSRVNTDIPVTQTLCRDNGASAAGWVQVDTQTAGIPPTTCWWLHPAPAGRQPRLPLRQHPVPAPAGGGRAACAHRGRHRLLGQQGRVAGLPERRRQDRGRYRLALPTPATAGQWINSSEVRPRFLVRRWDATTNSYSRLILDTDLLDPTTLLSAISPNNNNLLGLAPGTNYTLGLRWNSKAGGVLPASYLLDTVNFTVAADPGRNYWGLALSADVFPSR